MSVKTDDREEKIMRLLLQKGSATIEELLATAETSAPRIRRDLNRLDYLPEPDIFHDIAGHVPMHTDRAFADTLVRFGECAHTAADLVSQLHPLTEGQLEQALLALVQNAEQATTRSASCAMAFLMSSTVPQPGSRKTPSLLCVSASLVTDSISSSLSLARPTWSEEAPNPLPWPTSTTGTRAASAT